MELMGILNGQMPWQAFWASKYQMTRFDISLIIKLEKNVVRETVHLYTLITLLILLCLTSGHVTIKGECWVRVWVRHY